MPSSRSAVFLPFLLCCFVFFGPVQHAFSQSWKKAPVSKWVKPDSIDYRLEINQAEVDGGYYYMLVDEQVNVETKEYYSHYVYKIINDAGVQNASELYLDFNPAFQNLAIHSLRIYRNGQLLNKLESSAFKVIQRESELERHIYDNTLSVFTVLADVRAGDVIDYSYTIKGDNPIFEDKFHYAFSLSASYKLLKINERIVKKKSTPLNIKYYKEDKQPRVVDAGKDEEWVWNYTDIPQSESEENVPSYYRVSPLIEVSSYFNWSEVIEWATHVFEKEHYKHETIVKKAKSIREAYASDKDRIIAALRFVQNQIRYYGFEIGTNAIKPHSPDHTLTKRFGDCKDKAVLFCALLQEMGIDSCYPVLVHADKRDQVEHYIPSPNVFNHAIACIRLGHQNYFFDPTTSYEGGDFDHTYTTMYGKGLIVGPAFKGIEPILPPVLSKTSVDETYHILSKDGRSRLMVTTTYYGAHADNERYRFANNSLNDIKKNYLDFYKKKYGELSADGELEYKDDSILNKITITERYEIKCIWDTSEIREKKNTAYFCSDMVRDFTNRYAKHFSGRRLPVGIEQPLDIEHRIEVNLPEAWNIENSTDQFDSPYLEYARQISYAGLRLTLHYHLKVLQRTCEASDAKTFYTQLGHIRDNNWYTVYYGTQAQEDTPVVGKGGFNWLLFFFTILFILFMSLALVFIYTRSKKLLVQPVEIDPEKPYGINGWLIIPMLGLLINPVKTCFSLFHGTYFDALQWKQFTDPESASYASLWAPTILLQLMFMVTLVGLDFLCLVFLFTYDRHFKRYMIARLIAAVVFNVVLLFLFIALRQQLASSSLTSEATALLGSLIGASIWIPYFMVSARVQNTFRK